MRKSGEKRRNFWRRTFLGWCHVLLHVRVERQQQELVGAHETRNQVDKQHAHFELLLARLETAKEQALGESLRVVNQLNGRDIELWLSLLSRAALDLVDCAFEGGFLALGHARTLAKVAMDVGDGFHLLGGIIG